MWVLSDARASERAFLARSLVRRPSLELVSRSTSPGTHLESPLSRWVARLNYMFKTDSVQTRRTLLREPLPHSRQVSEVWTGDSHPASDDHRDGLPGVPVEAGSSKAASPHIHTVRHRARLAHHDAHQAGSARHWATCTSSRRAGWRSTRPASMRSTSRPLCGAGWRTATSGHLSAVMKDKGQSARRRCSIASVATTSRASSARCESAKQMPAKHVKTASTLGYCFVRGRRPRQDGEISGNNLKSSSKTNALKPQPV